MATLTSHLPVIFFTALYVLGFALYFLIAGNYEFVWYVAVLVFFFVVIGTTFKKTLFPRWILWALSLWGLMHMAGGGIKINGDILYTYQIVHLFGSGDSFVLKFDQVVHFYGFFVSTFVIHHLLVPRMKVASSFVILFVSVLAAMGLGALNELAEFFAVVVIGNTNVGGYFNTMIDVVANTLGALAAAAILVFVSRRQQKELGLNTPSDRDSSATQYQG